ncbi:hypothetical protein [Amycolatopsis minnesotensis]
MSNQDQSTPPRQAKRGKGRPPIGGEIRQEIGDDLKAVIETWAMAQGSNRAAAVRTLLRRGIDLELDPMSRTVVVEGDELHVLLGTLQTDCVRRVRFAFDSGLKVKVNDENWTPSLGSLENSATPTEKE